jgi:hypothetical protein
MLSISHRVQTEETNLKNVFLQLDHVPSKTTVLHGRSCNNFVAPHADIFKISPLNGEIICDIF